MGDTFQQLLQAGPLQALGVMLLAFVLYVLFGLLPITAAIYGIYFLVTLPMRRNERARMFLDLLELGLKEGRTPETAITEAAASRDESLGARFHLLALRLGQGLRLGQALDCVPRLLPPQLTAMLKAGERVGDVSKVLPACRLLLCDGISQVRGALNYLVLLAFVVTPFTIFVPIMLRIKVLPAFKAVFEGMFASESLPPITQLVFASGPTVTFIQLTVLFLVWFAALCYLGGPRLHAWFQRLSPATADWFLCLFPWRRKRFQRDFCAMLAVLLEAGVPEPEAVRLAGESTANAVFLGRAEKVRALLAEGVKLPEAIGAMDKSGELRWRLANALRRAHGFVRSLAGWQEALDAKAFQLEQTAAHVATTTLVLLNGAIVALIVIGLFVALIRLINQAVLW